MKKILSYLIQKTIIYIDIFIHRKRIYKYLLGLNLKINNIYDIGSNDGQYSLLFKKIFKSSKIFAFEPNSDLCEKFKNKVNKNKNIKVFNVAVGNDNKEIILEIDENSSLTTSLAKKNIKSSTFKIKKFLYGKSSCLEKKIRLIKLDSFINSKNKPNFIKIDVEGFEEEVLKGIKKNLKYITLIMIEFHFDKLYKGYNPNRIHKILLKNKFKHTKSIKFPILNWEDRFYIRIN